MKLVRFALADRVQFGSLQGDQIQPLEGELHALTAVPGTRAIPLGSVKLLTPTAASKVVAIGPGRRRVLRAGAAPPERPTLYFKPSTAVNNPEDPIIYPPELDYLNHEGEIGIVIGRLARRVKRESAAAHFLVSWISHIMTLLPGDVISTGAQGVGPLKPGDVVEVEIEGIGCLRNPVIAGG